MERNVSLPSAYSTISPVSFYPDKVTLNYQFENSFSAKQLSGCLFQNGFKSRATNAWSGKIYFRAAPKRRRLSYSLRVTHPRYGAPLNFYLDLNVLREVRALAYDPVGEIPTTAKDGNFIPAHLVQPDNRWAWQLMDDLHCQGFAAVSDLIDYIHAERPQADPPHCSHISVSSIEAAVDFCAINPRHLVKAYSSAFGALLSDNEHREYPSRAIRTQRPEANWMVHGFIANDDRIKMYAKTNRRVRWEYSFEKRAFARLKISRSLDGEERTFAAIFSRCAIQASRVLSALRARAQPIFNINQQHTPMDLVARLAACTRDQSTLRELLDCLIYTDKVDHSLFNRGLVDRLRKRGVLQPSLALGYSCVPLSYIRALNKLRRAQHEFFSTKLLHTNAKHSVIGRPSNRRPATIRNNATAHRAR